MGAAYPRKACGSKPLFENIYQAFKSKKQQNNNKLIQSQLYITTTKNIIKESVSQ